MAFTRIPESQGTGWGGPAKGAGKPARPFGAADSATGYAAQGTGRAAERRRLREERTALLETKLFDLAMEAERQETQMNAAVRLHAIYNGAPVATNVNLSADDVSTLSDDELRAELAQFSGAEASDSTGIEAETEQG